MRLFNEDFRLVAPISGRLQVSLRLFQKDFSLVAPKEIGSFFSHSMRSRLDEKALNGMKDQISMVAPISGRPRVRLAPILGRLQFGCAYFRKTESGFRLSQED